MKSLLAWLAFTALALPPDPAPAPPVLPVTTLEASRAWMPELALARLQDTYEGVTDLTAAFRQEVDKPDTGLTLTRSGTLFLKKPGLMRFDYAAPDPMFYVSDGSVLVQYLPAERLAYKLSVAGSSLAGPFRFLVGAARVADEWKVEGLADQGDTLALTVTPTDARAGYTRLVLTLAKEPFGVQGLEIHDSTGAVNRIRLSDVRRDPLPRSAFDVTIPAGVRVHDLSRTPAPSPSPAPKETPAP